jgi:hypothetical protein
VRLLAEELLDGPRGRRLCLELAMALDPAVNSAVMELGYDLDPGKGTSTVMLTVGTDADPADAPAPTADEVASAIARLGTARIEPGPITSSLQRAVDWARYWQAPDAEDHLAALPAIRAALRPLAERILGSSEAQWWSHSYSPDQWLVRWQSSQAGEIVPDPHSSTIEGWADDTRAEEIRAAKERPRDPQARYSGEWWSIPVGAPRTMARIPLGLGLIEDFQGWDRAAVIPVRGHGRVLEVSSAQDWVELCRAFALPVTASRRHDWYRTSGRDGCWVIPDWGRIAQEWDAAHLTVQAYLETAGRAVDVDTTTASVLAGWDPDTTIWLTDASLEHRGAPQTWEYHDDDWVQI